ncbi:flagellar biosynthetic protein FliO [Evansella sp. AB-P1]|uniref:flagellar biosynthetic protein FliO n=1 Tax=Evansella sp. AB-P1 TaxID=3037653 RepID=UPI00241D4DC2|nr:flagellar biosynthetic protein FliO [Evansella sp. AB-P1]MDG5788178.1 flagellar biosynthetic protein FliO [Evansella sp. AB-P1]
MNQLKRMIVYVVIALFLVTPSITFANDGDFGDGDGSVGDMFNSDPEDDDGISPTEGNSQEDNVVENEDLIASGNDQNLFLLSLQMFFALAVVIFLIYGLLKFVNSRSRAFRSHSTIESVGGVPLGSNRSVQIIRVGNKLFVVGVGDSIQLLKEIDDAEEIEQILEEHKPQEVFDQPISKATNWFKERLNRSSIVEGENQSFQHLLKRELKGVKESQEKVHSALKEKDR